MHGLNLANSSAIDTAFSGLSYKNRANLHRLVGAYRAFYQKEASSKERQEVSTLDFYGSVP